ncbi:hypothetical protein EDC04DRAFT_2612500 [Pisolithus marmoratus]|nr:hypothetical protein EDC04DRAFT_2612500 [Pisolithus marmoratus]
MPSLRASCGHPPAKKGKNNKTFLHRAEIERNKGLTLLATVLRPSGSSGLKVAIIRTSWGNKVKMNGHIEPGNNVDTEEATTGNQFAKTIRPDPRQGFSFCLLLAKAACKPEISIKIKPKLKDIPSSSSIDTASVVKDLNQIASLAKSFSDQRLKCGNDAHLADLLDQQGVNLWNASGLFRQDSDGRAIVAALRSAGFRLMEAGLESEPSIQGSEQNRPIFHIVVGAELGNSESAASVLTCAAKFEEALRNHSDPDRTHEHSKARVTTLYFSSRMEAVRLLCFYRVIGLIFMGILALAHTQAWREKNEGLAMFMADKITGLNPGRNRMRITKWLILSHQTTINNLHCFPSVTLLISHLSLLARITGNQVTGHREIHLRTCHQGGKLMAEGNRAPDALRWMQKAFQVIEPLECTPNSELAELKRAVLRSLARGYFLASSHDPENLTRAEVALEEIISTIDPSADHTSSEYQQLRWMKLAVVKRRKAGNIELLHELIAVITQHSHGASYPFSPVLIWQYGDRHYHASQWSEAADWFICGTNAVFSGLGPSCTSKCLRKAALCYIQQKEYARAAFAVKRCPVNGATTRYVAFLIAVHQGLEDEGRTRSLHELTLKLLGQPGANMQPLVKTLLNYFKNAKILVETAARENVALVIRDLSWLWRTAYNCAIDGCSNWDNHGEEVSNAFDIARQTLTEVEPSTYVYIANASFAATSGRGAEAVGPELLRSLSAEIKSCAGRIAGLLDKVPPADRSHLQSFLHFLRVFHVESASHLREWQTILETIEEATRDGHQSLVTYEAIGDVLYSTQPLSILLAKGSATDRSKAIQYFEQANAVLEEHGNLAENGNPLYPTDERLWLLSTAYNTGVECLHASLVDEARRWFECATVICRFVPNGKARAEKPLTLVLDTCDKIESMRMSSLLRKVPKMIQQDRALIVPCREILASYGKTVRDGRWTYER